MKTKTMLSNVLALVVVLSISMLALVGCTDGAPEDTPEDAQAVTSEVAENIQATDEQTEAVEAIPETTVEDNTTSVAATPNSDNNTTHIASQGSSGGNSGATVPNAPKAQSVPSKPAHEHNWVPITDTQTIIDREAWTEYKHYTCCSCGKNSRDDADFVSHCRNTGCSTSTMTVPIQHTAQTHTETVTVGYKCDCGATK